MFTIPHLAAIWQICFFELHQGVTIDLLCLLVVLTGILTPGEFAKPNTTWHHLTPVSTLLRKPFRWIWDGWWWWCLSWDHQFSVGLDHFFASSNNLPLKVVAVDPWVAAVNHEALSASLRNSVFACLVAYKDELSKKARRTQDRWWNYHGAIPVWGFPSIPRL